MPGIPNILSRFWQELIRRKVFKTIVMYDGLVLYKKDKLGKKFQL